MANNVKVLTEKPKTHKPANVPINDTGTAIKGITVARQFTDNADKTRGKSMIIIGAAMNHWYHADMNYRGVINLLMLCGCVGQSGGGWAHYVGQEKLRPQTRQ
jgi:nitrate reductase alpha subunit